jgi:hypothetical protein
MARQTLKGVERKTQVSEFVSSSRNREMNARLSLKRRAAS